MNLSKSGVKPFPEKKLAREKGKEEREELGGMIFISPPCFKPPETPMFYSDLQKVGNLGT